MIRRTDDFSLFSEKDLKKIAKVVEKKDSKTLFNTFEDQELARIAVKELRVNGYSADSYQAGNEWKVYIENSETVKLSEAEKSGAFKKIAFGRYVFEKNSSLEMHEYPFNHGSVWRVVTDENGNQALAKECSDESEEEVIRTASLKRIASSFAYVDANNFNNVFKIIFNITALNQVGTNFLNDLYNGSASNLQNYFIEKLNDDIDEYVNQILGGKALQQEEVDKVKAVIKENFDGGQLTGIQDIDRTIEEYIEGLTTAENGEEI